MHPNPSNIDQSSAAPNEGEDMCLLIIHRASRIRSCSSFYDTHIVVQSHCTAHSNHRYMNIYQRLHSFPSLNSRYKFYYIIIRSIRFVVSRGTFNKVLYWQEKSICTGRVFLRVALINSSPHTRRRFDGFNDGARL